MRLQKNSKPRIGIIGSGFIAKGLVNLIIQKNELEISGILTRTKIHLRTDFFPRELMTNSIKKLIDNSDLIVECSGSVEYAAKNIMEISKSDIPVVTMNTEFHVTIGSYFVGKMFITEGEGDQPGSLAALNEEIKMMGFSPLVYGNIKGYLNENPTFENMKIWAKKNKLSLHMTTSFTDGTKVQMEQAFVANGLGCTILQRGMTGIEGEDIQNIGSYLARKACKDGHVISDYIISKIGPPGVFITATHDKRQRDALAYYKMGSGPFYTLLKVYHLPHLELYKSLLKIMNEKKILLNNSLYPTVSVAAIAKKNLEPGAKIEKAAGGFELRGEAVIIDEFPNHIPIGLLNNATLKRKISQGEILEISDVDLKDETSLEMWFSILESRKQSREKLSSIGLCPE